MSQEPYLEENDLSSTFFKIQKSKSSEKVKKPWDAKGNWIVKEAKPHNMIYLINLEYK